MATKHALEGNSLTDFLASCPQQLPAEQRAALVARAKLLLESYYVHNPPAGRGGPDPLGRLDQLAGEKIPAVFHDEMLSIFNSLHDLHTTYMLPMPFRAYTAVLPFRVQAWYENDGEPRFAVTELEPDAGLPSGFKNGVEVLTWDGVPIGRVVAESAERQAGANSHAQFALAVETLTARPLGFCSPPQTELVHVEYAGPDGPEAAEPEWRVLPVKDRPERDRIADVSALGAIMGLNALLEAVRRSRKQRLKPDEIAAEWEAADALSGVEGRAEKIRSEADGTLFPDALRFDVKQLSSREPVAYLRIRSFRVADVDAFVSEVARILDVLASKDPIGLLVDVRGNGGGAIPAAEKLLQLLTPKEIEPQWLQFRSTDGTKTLSGRHEPLFPWYPSIERQLADNRLSEGFPLWPTYKRECNLVGQVFHGPVALLVDARCYSATEIFAAGFQEHEIGTVIGADPSTGAGSANVWSDRLVAQLLPGGRLTQESTLNRESAPDPARTQDGEPAQDPAFTVAIRRVARAGARGGEPHRDAGISLPAEDVRRPTHDDLLHDNKDLVEFAGRRLLGRPTRVLRVEQDGDVLKVTTAGIERLEATLDGRGVPIEELGKGGYALPLPPDGRPHLVELRGFDGTTNEPVAMVRHHTGGADGPAGMAARTARTPPVSAERGGALPPWPDFDDRSTAEVLRLIEHTLLLSLYTQNTFLTALLEYELSSFGLGRPEVVEAARAELTVLSSMLGTDEATKRWGSTADATKRWGQIT